MGLRSGTWEANAELSELTAQRRLRARPHRLPGGSGLDFLLPVAAREGRTVGSQDNPQQRSAEVACLVPYCAPRDRQEYTGSQASDGCEGLLQLGSHATTGINQLSRGPDLVGPSLARSRWCVLYPSMGMTWDLQGEERCEWRKDRRSQSPERVTRFPVLTISARLLQQQRPRETDVPAHGRGVRPDTIQAD